MKNKGFTLIEIITVLAILAVVTITIVPIIINQIDENKIKAYNLQITSIKSAAENWALKNISSIPDSSGDVLTLNLADLKAGGYIDIDVINPLTNKSFPNDMIITITKVRNQYVIEVDENSGHDITEENIIVRESPIIVLNGSYLTYVELNDEYVEQGAYAYSYLGENLTNLIGIEIVKDDTQRANVDTSSKGTYKIYYIISDPNNNYRNTAIRTVIVRDTTAPEIFFDESTIIYSDEVSDFDFMEGVYALDNSGEVVPITYEAELNPESGNYIITYTATDSSNNVQTKKRLIRVMYVK